MTLLTLPLKVNLDRVQFTDEQFYQLCLSCSMGGIVSLGSAGSRTMTEISPIAPDFVIELRSRTDNLQTLQDKMLEYLQSGVRLGWLFNPQNQQV